MAVFRSACLPLSLVFCLSFLPSADAQLSAEELRREQIETIEALRRTEDISGGSSHLFGNLGRKTGWRFSYGAASSLTYTGGDNGTDRNSSLADAQDHNYDYEVKPFVNISTADGRSKFYTRLTTKYTETKKNSPAIRGSNYVQPTIDMMYWEKKLTSKQPGVKRKMVIGRQFVQVGRGIAFAQTADGFFYESTGLGKKKGEYKWFVLRAPPGTDRTDPSASGPGRSNRYFYGIRGKYQLHPKAKMSLYTVHSRDRNSRSSFNSILQLHKFEPQYYGVVSEGRLTKDLQYWGEYITERGKTYANATTVPSQEVDINATALVAGLRYFFPGDLRPTLYAEFLQASGDPEATSSNSSLNGSAAGTKDSRFVPFGGLSLGFALSPTMTNMKVYKIGGSVKPFARSVSRLLQDMTLQPEYYLFRRRTGKTGAAGNDSQITGAATTDRIGDEIDFSVSWRLMSDVVYQLRYGHFSPGSAYATTSSETYWRFKVSVDL